jgi:hypothetical protein
MRYRMWYHSNETPLDAASRPPPAARSSVMTARLIAVTVVLVLPCLALPAAAAAQAVAWPGDPLVNVPIATVPGEKYDVFVVSDGCGGVIMAWEDRRSGDFDIYAQRLDVNGQPLWQPDGVPVCTAFGHQRLYHSSTGTTGFTPLVADGDGGVWIVWQDERAFASNQRDIYLQRLDADGRPRFQTDGLPVAARPGMEDQPTLCLDGAGGVFVVWQDRTVDPVFSDLHGQRVGPDGELLWNGGVPLPLVVVGWDQKGPSVSPDGTGGFFLAWVDARDDVGDIYAQRFAADGQPLWQAGHVPVAVASDGQDAVVAAHADDGALLLAWVDRRGGGPDIYAQKLAPGDGSALWTANGRAVCTATDSQFRPALAGDGEGGAIIAWFDYRNASGPPWNLDIYAQRITAAGAAAWTHDGVQVCGAPGPQRDVAIAADGQGGAFLVWEDDRLLTGREDIYAQRIDRNGQSLWTDDGVPVCLASGNQQRPAVALGAGGVITAWRDDRAVLWQPDIYADRVLATDQAVIGVNRALLALGGPDQPDVGSFLVSNVGASPLLVSEVELETDSDISFLVTPDQAPPFILQPGEAVAVTVMLTAGAGRSGDDGRILVHHDAQGQPSPQVVRLRGGDPATAAPGGPAPSVPAATLRAHPNPFNPQVTVAFSLPAAGAISLHVHDLAGRRVRTLLDRVPLAAGPHTTSWDGRDQAGRAVPSGTYLLRLTGAGATAVRSVTLVR